MIIFDLDGTLADCEHRRHFVDPSKNYKYRYWFHGAEHPSKKKGDWYNSETEKADFKPDWKAFYEACDKDEPIESTLEVFKLLAAENEVQIWSGRCESVRFKTELWLWDHAGCGFDSTLTYPQILKMRPIGDSTPDDVLKEKWLDEIIEENKKKCLLRWDDHTKCCSEIEYVFDDRPKVVRMYRRRGIFVFNCLQHDEEF